MIKAVRSSAHTGLSLARSGPRSLFLALACVCFAYGAGESATSDWNCFRLADGAFMGRVSIWWGHEREDAQWACNNWIADCGNGGGCVSTGDKSDRSCNVPSQMDGCSAPLNDAVTAYYKQVFHEACNAHDACYRAPWARMFGPERASDGFEICNENFWNDMNEACALLGQERWWNFLPCSIVASSWATAMNTYLRAQFWHSFMHAWYWVQNNCEQ